MKKISILLLSLVFLSSCKKNYNCRCSTTIFSQNGQDYYISKNTAMDKKTTKKQAKAICDHEAETIDATYMNLFTNSGNRSSNGNSAKTYCYVQ